MSRGMRAASVLFAALVPLATNGAMPMTTAGTSAAELQRGRYLAIVGDCEACHTAPGGKPFAGGLPVATPVGRIVSSNITPSRTDGIGDDSFQQFSDALRRGIRHDGKRLYPAMPYTAYAEMTDADVRALYAYFMHGIQPVDSRASQTHLPFPFNIRASMALWNLLFLASKPYAADAHRSAQWNRGAYLVLGLAHCGTCHTPRNWLFAEESSRALSGASLGTWFAPNITPNVDKGIGDWSSQEIVDYLKRGRATGKGRAEAAGPMAEAVDHSLRHLTDADLRDIAIYLRSIPARGEAGDARAVDAWGGAYSDLASIRGRLLPEDRDRMTGPQLYEAYCATCHQDRAQGSFDGGLPPLFHNTATGRRNTDNLVMTILEGIVRSNGSDVLMPGFAQELSDRQMVTLGNYLTQHFGNPAATVTLEQVRILRGGGASSSLVLIAQIVVAVVLVILVLVVLGISRAFPRRAHPSMPSR